ncbi:hypothetical protein [Exiguobacterium artemiae]|uniref:hypothetical protein n=1 Tax=Exiguobacterium artemiae TaxID=340145 RepID=UPI00047E4687|nr:hypothetical protein [Exiguobacterium sibiricum]
MKIKNILIILNSNFIMLAGSLLLTFLIPIYLSVNDFAEYRKYILYISYIGLFSFGFIDGSLLKYGHKYLENKTLFIQRDFRFILKFQIIISLIIVVISLAFKDLILFLLALVIFPINMTTYFKMIYQATGSYKNYSLLNIMYSIINTLSISFVIYLGLFGYKVLIIATLLSYWLVYFVAQYKMIKFSKQMLNNNLENDYTIKNIFSIGYIVLISNLAILFFYNIGLWVVNFLFSNSEFANYSLANSMQNMILLIVNSASVVFFKYIFSEENDNKIKKINEILLFLGIVSFASFFILKAIIDEFFADYTSSLHILKFLIMCLPFTMVYNISFINYYKKHNLNFKMLKSIVYLSIFNLIISIIISFVFEGVHLIAFASFLSSILLNVYVSLIDLKIFRINMKQWIYILITISIFYFLSEKKWYVGLSYYVIYLVLSLILFMLLKKKIRREP